MSKKKIAIQGELGAYSHIAAENLYKDPEIKTCATFEETFREAHNDPDCKIVIPIENSLEILNPKWIVPSDHDLLVSSKNPFSIIGDELLKCN